MFPGGTTDLQLVTAAAPVLFRPAAVSGGVTRTNIQPAPRHPVQLQIQDELGRLSDSDWPGLERVALQSVLMIWIPSQLSLSSVIEL
jgi:hypothetical protein